MTSAEQVVLNASDQAAVNGTHYIEEVVRVPLMRDLDGINLWVLDPAALDLAPESDYDGPQNRECRCGQPEECAVVVNEMAEESLPDAEELMHILATALGFTAIKNELIDSAGVAPALTAALRLQMSGPTDGD
ncbi:hypothetical protein ABIC28_005093 [Rhodococcus sp. PvR044]|uniref:hypothetical protein n=1 Tax=Rhodococcus sp. PvR044 TaxID=3156402 RepID=UPI003393C1E7